MSSVSFSGIASGIDGDAIIQSTVDARRLTKVPLENRIAQNEAEVSALDVLRQKVVDLESKLRQFATFSGTAISKSVATSNDNSISAVVSSAATPTTLSVTVEQLASTSRVTFNDTFPAQGSLVAPDIEDTGTIQIKVGTGSSEQLVEIEVTNETTLTELALKVSEALPGKLTASLVNVGSENNPQFRLMLTTQETGIEKGFIEISFNQSMEDQGIFSNYQLIQAKDALISVEGIGSIQRGRNTISDLIPGLTIELKEASPLPVQISITNDNDKTAKKVLEFVESYNEIVKFISQENKIERIEDERGTRNEFGALARTRLDSQLLASLRGALSGTSLDEEGAVRIFADIGITTDRFSGELSFDQEVFTKALSSNGQQVNKLLQSFSDKVSSTGGIISSYTSFNGLFDQQKNSKKTMNQSINKRLEQMERSIEQQRDFLKRMFSRLEETIGQLNSNATALSGIITQQSKK
jgi:flagellar hook-associated protein 2